MKTNAIRLSDYGGPDVMKFVEVDLPAPGPGEARILHTAIGLNFIDTYHRSGLYPEALPCGLGSEAAGVVEAIGPDVTDVEVGQRVVYTGRPADSYSERRNFPAAQLVPLPDDVGDEAGAAMLLKGLTSWYLLKRSYPARQGDTVLLYAAAGGVGSILSQWAQHMGVNVIGVVSTDAKAELARNQGCTHVVMADDDVAARARELTSGEGVAAVYDSVGKDTFFA
ncbi:MAG: quinone oxidoreductase, partial [Woeseia sp.]